jgi:hypothetical protein
MALVVLVALWLLAIPFSGRVAAVALNRFQLQSTSFFRFAIQLPVPSMYNFANWYAVSSVPPGSIDQRVEIEVEKGYINHFPSRVFTWAEGRSYNFEDGQDRWVTLKSSYRGLTLQTRWHARPDGRGGFELLRLPVQDGPR